MISDNLKIFIAESDWIFAKTYAKTWPQKSRATPSVNCERLDVECYCKKM